MIKSREIKNPSVSSVFVIQCFFNQIWLFLIPRKQFKLIFEQLLAGSILDQPLEFKFESSPFR